MDYNRGDIVTTGQEQMLLGIGNVFDGREPTLKCILQCVTVCPKCQLNSLHDTAWHEQAAWRFIVTGTTTHMYPTTTGSIITIPEDTSGGGCVRLNERQIPIHLRMRLGPTQYG